MLKEGFLREIWISNLHYPVCMCLCIWLIVKRSKHQYVMMWGQFRKAVLLVG